MMNAFRFMLFVGFGALCLGWLVAEEPSAEQVSKWIDELDDPRYQIRELASRRLLELRESTIPKLLEALHDGSPERSNRILQILIQLAQPEDPSLPSQAFEALQSIATLQVAAASSGARGALNGIREQQLRRAVEKLRAMKTSIDYAEVSFGQERRTVEHLRVPIDFSGTAEDLRWVRWLHGIECAVLQGPSIDAPALREVSQMPDLQSLVLFRTVAISAKDLEIFIERPLLDLELMYVPFAENSGETLGRLAVRGMLRITGKFPAEELERLKAARGNLAVSHLPGTLLGVKCHPAEPICRVSEVIPNSAASVGGVMQNDIITRVEKANIRNYDDLRRNIALYESGQVLTIEVRRIDPKAQETQILELSVRLGEMQP